MISKNMLSFWKPWCTSNIFTFEFECTLKTLIYFSMIPPLLLLGMITTMSGSSTLANWRELWTLLCLQNCCKKCTFNVYSNSYSPFLFVPVSETAVSICQAQPTYWGKKNKNKNVWGQEKLHLFLLHFVTFVCLLRGKLISQFSAEEKASWAELQPMKPFQVLQLCWIAFQLHANVKELLSEEPIPGKSASHILKKHLEKNVSSSFVSGRTVVSIFQWIFTLFFGRSYLRYNSMYIVTVERSEILSDFIDGGHGSMNWKRRMVKDQWSTSYSERSCTRNIYNNK